MGIAFTYQGASGETYEFMLFEIENANAIPHQGGLVIFANYTPQPLFVGEAPDIHRLCTRSVAWVEATSLHKADRAYLLVEPDERKRLAIQADLVEYYDPPMNKGVQLLHRPLDGDET